MEFYTLDTMTALYCAMLLPFLAMAGNMAFSGMQNVRDTFTLLCAVLTFSCVLMILSNVGKCD